MGYLHISNLYKDQAILLFRRCYALEKVHGTSAHISWKDCDPRGELRFFSGGEKHERFTRLFDEAQLREGFDRLGHAEVIVYGEAYGGAQQGMSETYGKELRFIAFDVKVGSCWLSVPQMTEVATGLGLEVVPWVELPAEIDRLDEERDKPSVVAFRRGCGSDKKREGIVLRPLIELIRNNGERVIAKHKRADFEERATPQKVVGPAELVVLRKAEAIANEWVTEERLNHVVAHLTIRGVAPGLEQTGRVIKEMVADVLREAAGEIVDSKEARRAISKRAGQLFRARVTSIRT